LSTALSARELTAPGRGAIRVLELSGEAALERVARMAQPGRAPAPGAFALLSLRDPRGALLDEAIVLTVSPERVELHLHGAPALVARILAELGVALEESPRGTLEQRAEACLARAPSEAAARVLLDQVQGALRAELEALLRRSDGELVAVARELARRGRVARWLVCPPRVMLAGPVNAGKSTLFNVLVGRERVVVDPTPGTTRDAVRERVHLGAYAVDLYDSAGERALEGSGAHSSSERAGQALAAELRRAADLVLWLVPPGHEPPRAEPTRTRIVRSCADLERADSPRSDGPRISARFAPAEARSRVEELVHAALGLPLDPWIPGAGVPFELEWVEELERDEPARLRRAVRAWLAPD
jgi:tRNA modification GTPase